MRTFIPVVMLAALAVAGCDKHDTDRANAQAQAAGEKLDRAAERAGQSLSDAAKKTGAAMNEGANQLQPKLQDAGEKMQAAVQKAGDQVSAAAASAETSDTGITATIKARYVGDPNLSALKIEVDTEGGVVTLNGLVKDEAARQWAGQIATSVKGVSAVKNHLVLKQ